MKLEKLIDEHEKRRHAFVSLAIEKDIEIEERENPSVYSRFDKSSGTKRYDYKKGQRASNIISSTGTRPTTSIAHAGKNPKIQSDAPKTPAKNLGPVSSISKLPRSTKNI